MTGTIAQSALIVSLGVVTFGAIMAPLAISRGRRDWLQIVYGSVYTNFLLVSVATIAMIVALVTHDFSVSYVANVGSRSTPLLFTVISLWGALEGSILFWAWVLAMYAAAVVYLHSRRPGNLIPYASMTLLAVSAFFAILLVGPADPFLPVFPVPLDGNVAKGHGFFDTRCTASAEREWRVASADDTWGHHQRKLVDQSRITESSGHLRSALDEDALQFAFAQYVEYSREIARVPFDHIDAMPS